jgi:hypothetical protein
MAILPPHRLAPEPAPALDATGPICVTAYVHGSYQDYIPVFVYSVLRSYPEYFVRIFLKEHLQPHNRKALDVIRAGMCDRFEVRENTFARLDGFILRGSRWLLPHEALSDFEYAYISDVDFLICRETPDIRARHVGYCRANNLPYSNACRIKSPPVKKLTGLHFIVVKPYYEAMSPVIEQVRVLIKSGSPHPYADADDESMLYDLVARGIGRFPPLWFRPGHGIHLGAIRCGKILDRADLRAWAPFLIGELLPDPVYRKIKKLMAPSIRRQLLWTQALCGHWWHGLR